MNKFLVVIFIFVSCQLVTAQDTILKYNGDLVFGKVLEITSTEIKYKRFNFLEGPTYIDRKSDIKLIKYSNGFEEEFPYQAPAAPVNGYVPQDAYYNPAGQNPNYNYNIPNPSNYNKIEQRGSRYLYRNNFMSENSLHKMLLKAGNKEIVYKVGKSKDAKALQYIGFGAIPLGIGAIYFLMQSQSGFYGQYGISVNNGDLALSAVCLVGAIACPIGSGIFKHKRKINNIEAIELYNAKY